jgi:serine/threonine protein phosphatase 1
VETLQSYGIEASPWQRPDALRAAAQAAVPEAHRAFLAALPGWHLEGEVLFVHAGIRPGIDLTRQTETDLLWIRDVFLNDPRDHGPLVVHGHSPVAAATHYGNRINIDSGVAYGGPLSAIVLEGRDAFLLSPSGRVPLLPQALP